MHSERADIFEVHNDLKTIRNIFKELFKKVLLGQLDLQQW